MTEAKHSRSRVIRKSHARFCSRASGGDSARLGNRFIKDPETIPPEFLRIPEIKEAMDLLTKMSADPETRAEYEARQKELNDFYAGQSVKYEEGLKECEKKGREDERVKTHQEKIDSARKFLAMGLSIDQVAQDTALSIDEVQQLK